MKNSMACAGMSRMSRPSPGSRLEAKMRLEWLLKNRVGVSLIVNSVWTSSRQVVVDRLGRTGTLYATECNSRIVLARRLALLNI